MALNKCNKPRMKIRITGVTGWNNKFDALVKLIDCMMETCTDYVVICKRLLCIKSNKK